MQALHGAEQHDSGEHPRHQPDGRRTAHPIAVAVSAPTALVGPAAQRAGERGQSQQQGRQQLEPQSHSRQRPDPRQQARGRRRHDRDSVALGLGGLRVAAPRFIDRELGFGVFPAQPFGAVEHECRVPRAAVGRADRIRAVVRRDKQGGGEPRQRHGHVDGRGHGQLGQPPAARGGQAQPGDHRQPRQRDHGLQQLHVEGDPERGGGAEQQCAASGLTSAQQQQQG